MSIQSLTDTQARRERIAELRVDAIDCRVQYGNRSTTAALYTELADALEHIDNVEKDRTELNSHLEFAWETNRNHAARIDALEKALREIQETAQWNAEAKGSNEERFAWGALALSIAATLGSTHDH